MARIDIVSNNFISWQVLVFVKASDSGKNGTYLHDSIFFDENRKINFELFLGVESQREGSAEWYLRIFFFGFIKLN